jgi:hypothetical protein
MRTIAQPRCGCNAVNLPIPVHIFSYVDVLRGWREWALNRKQHAVVARNCTKLQVWRKRCPFTGRVSYRYTFYRPNRVALGELQEAEHFQCSYAELAIDLIFPSSQIVDEAAELFDRYNVVPRHRGKMIKLYKTTRYTGLRSARNNLVSYPDKPSRVSGERNCLHIEMRIRGSETLQRHGIFGVGNLIRFEVTEFWRKHLRFYTFDREKAGRLFRRGTESKLTDSQIGHRLWQASGFDALNVYKSSKYGRHVVQDVCGKMQHFVDNHSRWWRVDRCLKRIDAEAWIPTIFNTSRTHRELEIGVLEGSFILKAAVVEGPEVAPGDRPRRPLESGHRREHVDQVHPGLSPRTSRRSASRERLRIPVRYHFARPRVARTDANQVLDHRGEHHAQVGVAEHAISTRIDVANDGAAPRSALRVGRPPAPNK